MDREDLSEEVGLGDYPGSSYESENSFHFIDSSINMPIPSIVGVGNAGTAYSQQSTVPVDALESAAYDIVAENVQHSNILDEDASRWKCHWSEWRFVGELPIEAASYNLQPFGGQRSQKREKEHHGGAHCKVAQQQEEL